MHNGNRLKKQHMCCNKATMLLTRPYPDDTMFLIIQEYGTNTIAAIVPVDVHVTPGLPFTNKV